MILLLLGIGIVLVFVALGLMISMVIEKKEGRENGI